MNCRSDIKKLAGKRPSVSATRALLLAAVATALPAASASAAELLVAGVNQYGQLGNGTSGTTAEPGLNSALTPVPVAGFNYGITAMATGGAHSYAAKTGAFFGWGLNQLGQVGNGTSTFNYTTPQTGVVLTSGVTALQGSLYAGFAIADGTMYSWGGNTDGILSNGVVNSTSSPTPVVGLGSGPVTAISSSARHVVAIQNGSLYAWGYSTYGQIGNNDRTMFFGDERPPVRTPFQVPGFASGVTLAAAGGLHTVAVKNNAVYAWGSNQYGQLGSDGITGTGTFDSLYATPQPVVGLPAGTVTDVTAGTSFSLALVGGSVYAWGRNEVGQLGNDSGSLSKKAIPVAGITGPIIDIEAGNASAYALAADGSLWVWGNNTYGQLGLGSTDTPFTEPQHLLPAAGYRFDGLEAAATSSHVMITRSALPVYFTGAAGTNLNAVGNFAANLAGTTPAPIGTVESTDVYFGAATATPTGLAGATVVGAMNANSLTFGTGGSAGTPVTVGGAGAITLYADKNVYAAGTGIVVQGGAGAVTINAPIVVAQNQSWTNNSTAPLNVNGAVDLGARSLTLAGGGNTLLNGVVSGSGGVTKSGAGTVSLTGSNTYTGTTTVAAGTLQANAAARTALLANGTDIKNGQVNFDYTGATPAATIRGLLAGSFTDTSTPGVMDSGTLRSSSATPARGLGYRDTGTTVIVKAALYGDADLDGGVSINDFNALAGNFGAGSGKVWVDGDFDYDGGVSINDFNLLAGGFGQTLPPTSEAWAGLLAFAAAHDDMAAFTAITGVPEPTSLGLLAAGATLGVRRRRR